MAYTSRPSGTHLEPKSNIPRSLFCTRHGLNAPAIPYTMGGKHRNAALKRLDKFLIQRFPALSPGKALATIRRFPCIRQASFLILSIVPFDVAANGRRSIALTSRPKDVIAYEALAHMTSGTCEDCVGPQLPHNFSSPAFAHIRPKLSRREFGYTPKLGSQFGTSWLALQLNLI